MELLACARLLGDIDVIGTNGDNTGLREEKNRNNEKKNEQSRKGEKTHTSEISKRK